MTLYRRHIAKNYISDQHLPPIFNEYMHLSWDSPSADRTKVIAPLAASAGAEYYVIDCGWHNEEPGDKIYPYVGQWKQSNARFPEGIRKTTDYIRSLGMKAGLWIEPEVVGILCEDMLAYYGDDCYLQRFGKRLAVSSRHFLDFRNDQVRQYMTETIRRMVEEYGADYIKFDYNQDCGVGTDLNALTAGKGLEDATNAYFDWLTQMHCRFPNVVFEGCASGGLRMDHKTLSAFSLMSTSDQIHYDKYPYIAGNILSAVLPEQAAVWSYPVTENCMGADVSDDRIAMNMINSFLGRMHLASHLEKLNEYQMALIQEGVAYYNNLTAVKKRALPYFPNGFTHFGAWDVSAGLKDGDKIYLAVWNLGTNGDVRVQIPNVQNVTVGYPQNTEASFAWDEEKLTVSFPRTNMAVFIEIEL
jgi:alpha-galactosidase